MLFALVTLYAWLPVVLLLFAVLPARRAVLATYLTAWLFLPLVEIELIGLPDLNKVTLTAAGAMLGVCLFDAGALSRFRLRWFDLPLAAFCLMPVASSLGNGLGAYEGLATSLTVSLFWGVAYFLGRVYFSEPQHIRELAIAIFIGGLIYVPLCLFEMRMSPQLNAMVYGFQQHSFAQTQRFGGYRPVVFMQHGLAVGMWMTCTALVGLWLWWTGSLRRLWGLPTGPLVAALLITAVLCKSTLALVLLLLGIVALAAIRWARSRLVIVALILAAPAYMVSRAALDWRGGPLLTAATQVFGAERASSLSFRMDNEDLLVGKALESPLLGWGGSGRFLVRDKFGRNLSVPDGFWVIALGQNGIPGVAALTLVLLLPAAMFVRSCPPGSWMTPLASAPAILSVLLVLHMLDNLLNAMINPFFPMAAGAVSGCVALVEATRARPAGSAAPIVLTAAPAGALS